MTRLYTQEVSAATGQAEQLFKAIKSAVGKVPNAYRDIGSNSAVALEAALHVDGALRKSSLSAIDIEIVKLAVSEIASCDYCLAAHTLMAGKNGMSADAIRSARFGKPSGVARNDALSAFVRRLVSSRGRLEDDVLNAVKEAGVTDAQIVDVFLAISSITFTNLFNRVNDTALDFPPVE